MEVVGSDVGEGIGDGHDSETIAFAAMVRGWASRLGSIHLSRIPFRIAYWEATTVNDSDTNKLLLVIIAILLPPLAVGLKEGVGAQLILNIILCLFFWLPGLLHALWVVLK